MKFKILHLLIDEKYCYLNKYNYTKDYNNKIIANAIEEIINKINQMENN